LGVGVDELERFNFNSMCCGKPFDKWLIAQCVEQTSFAHFAFADEDEFGFVEDY